jgi:hypothetical protein
VPNITPSENRVEGFRSISRHNQRSNANRSELKIWNIHDGRHKHVEARRSRSDSIEGGRFTSILIDILHSRTIPSNYIDFECIYQSPPMGRSVVTSHL